MTEEFDTSWFDLKNYNKLSEHNLEGWFQEILLRRLIFSNADEALYESFYEAIKNAPVTPITDLGDELGEEFRGQSPRFPFNTFSVKSVEASTFRHIATDSCLDDIWSQCDYTCDSPREQQKLVDSPLGLIYKERGYVDSHHFVAVDLTAYDTQIMSDFRHWLTEYRNVIGVEPSKKKFAQTKFDYWIAYGVIPYLDLTMTAKKEGKKITQNKLARLIFPDEFDIDIVGRMRQVTKPEAEYLMSNGWEALAAQLGAEE